MSYGEKCVDEGHAAVEYFTTYNFPCRFWNVGGESKVDLDLV